MNPFLSVWLQPRETIRYILVKNPRMHVVVLGALMGLNNALEKASEKDMGDQFSIGTLLLIILVSGPILGVAFIWLWGWLMRVTGEWLGGTVDSVSLRAAAAWSSVPMISVMVLWIPLTLVYGGDLFRSSKAEIPLFVLSGVSMVGIAALGWTMVLWSKMVAEVQGYGNAWKGFLNIILAGVIHALLFLIVATASAFLIFS